MTLNDVNRRRPDNSFGRFLLMNKDEIIHVFEIAEYDGEQLYVGEHDYVNATGKVSEWLSARMKSAWNRGYIRKFLQRVGADNLIGFIKLTNCASLTDTHWVKPEDSTLKWKDVNLYNGKFEDIYDGTYDGDPFPICIPDLTTNGTYDKHWVVKNGIYLIKAGSTGASNAGMEPYSEVLASQVFKQLIVGSTVEYRLNHYNGRAVSECKLFTNESLCFVPHAQRHKDGKGTIEDMLREYSHCDSGDLFRRMMVADAITVNSDRHFGNFGWMRRHRVWSSLCMAPPYDFNMCFSPYADGYHGFDNYDAYLRECVPAIGTTYVRNARSVLTEDIRSDLTNMKHMDLNIPCDDKFTTDRLDKINNIKDVMIDRILGRSAVFAF